MRLTVTILVAACLLGPGATAAPMTMAHQGRLTDAVGSTVPDAVYDLTYRLFDADVSGNLLWEEFVPTQTSGGLFSVVLGESTPLDLASLGIRPDSLWLEIQVGADAPLTPRTQLRPVASAASALSVDGDFKSSVGTIAMFDSQGDTTALTRSGDDGTIQTFTWTQTGGPYKFSTARTTVNDSGVTQDYIADLAAGPPGRVRLKLRLYRDGLMDTSTTTIEVDTATASFFQDILGNTTSLGVSSEGAAITFHAFDNSFSTTVSDDGVETTSTDSSATHRTVVKFKAGAELAKKVNMRDTNNDGIPNLSATFGVDSTALMWLDDDSDDDGIPEATHRTQVDGDQSSSYWDTDSDSDDIPESYSLVLTTADSVVRENSFSYDDPGNGLVTMKAKERGNRTKCGNNLRREAPSTTTEYDVGCDSLTSGSRWTAEDNLGSLASLTIQASLEAALNPIEHSSGAHLTPGGVWTNASDENLKENFQPVDGEAILKQIDALPISQWNYRVEGDEMTHIGPTAQDFQAAFGLGGSDKTISTIDPAGVALAAIKALHKKSKRIDELEARVAELTALMEQLVPKVQ